MPGLSQIQKLEEELGVIIFDRKKQPVVPTDIGKKIISQARIILQEAERLENIINSETGEFSGTLKIGVIPTIAPYLIPLFLQSFKVGCVTKQWLAAVLKCLWLSTATI